MSAMSMRVRKSKSSRFSKLPYPELFNVSAFLYSSLIEINPPIPNNNDKGKLIGELKYIFNVIYADSRKHKILSNVKIVVARLSVVLLMILLFCVNVPYFSFIRIINNTI